MVLLFIFGFLFAAAGVALEADAGVVLLAVAPLGPSTSMACVPVTADGADGSCDGVDCDEAEESDSDWALGSESELTLSVCKAEGESGGEEIWKGDDKETTRLKPL